IVEPPTGFNIGSLNPNMATTIKFSVTVDNTIPSPNPILNNSTIIYNSTFGNNSNEVSTQVNSANLGSITKYTDKVYADCGDVITYTIAIPNIGNSTALNIVLKDTLPNGIIFVTDSVFINGFREIGANPNTGISIPNIYPGQTTTVTFEGRVQC
ncbi:DUF11 domain-containing protein, partial [Clostridium botulinum]|nr:DUF11 domain-containing protein [Clostridium botulinum]